MAVKRFTGPNMEVQLETSEGNMVELPNLTEVRLDDGSEEEVEFEGGDYVQVGHGLPAYFVEVDYEVDPTDDATGSWYVAQQVDRLDDEARFIHFYPAGSTGSLPYWAQDSLFRNSMIPSLNKRSGKGMATLRAVPHVQSSATPAWTDAPEAST